MSIQTPVQRVFRPLSKRLRVLAPPTPCRKSITTQQYYSSTPFTREKISNVLHHKRPAIARAPRPSRSSFVQLRSFTSTIPVCAKAIANPRKDDDGKEMLLEISPRASNRLSAIATNENNPSLCLRVAVESGGCHGFQYLMSLTSLDDVSQEEDTIFESEDGKGSRVVLDESSLELLKGSTIDYTMELIGSQFKVTGIPGAKSSCGCGTSFDIQV